MNRLFRDINASFKAIGYIKQKVEKTDRFGVHRYRFINVPLVANLFAYAHGKQLDITLKRSSYGPVDDVYDINIRRRVSIVEKTINAIKNHRKHKDDVEKLVLSYFKRSMIDFKNETKFVLSNIHFKQINTTLPEVLVKVISDKDLKDLYIEYRPVADNRTMVIIRK